MGYPEHSRLFSTGDPERYGCNITRAGPGLMLGVAVPQIHAKDCIFAPSSGANAGRLPPRPSRDMEFRSEVRPQRGSFVKSVVSLTH